LLVEQRDLEEHDIIARASPGCRAFKRSDGYVDPGECVIPIPG
jgi:hypothetical protein